MKNQLIASTLLAASLLTTACGGDAPSTDTTASGETTAAAVEDKYLDDLPADLNLDGETVTFLYRAEKSNEFWAESETGDIVDDALFKSISSVEERLNVDITAELREGHYNPARGEYMSHVSNTILAGDALYDWVDLMIGNSPVKMSEGIFLDLAANKYIDTSKPYYLANIADTVAIDGKLYFISGDASLGYMKTAFCLYFNQRVADDFKIDSLYSLVDSGEWTVDKLAEISTIASQDLNGDNVYDLNDKLGFVVHDMYSGFGFLGASDTKVYDKDASGDWKLTYGSERDLELAEKVSKLIHETVGSYHPMISNGNAEHLEKYNEITAKFASGDIFIMTAEFDDSVVGLRDMKDTFGILPMPKFDEQQENYKSIARNTHNAFSMPVTCANPDAAGAVMEALAASNRETVLPAYFETALKTKYSRDNDSARMYDIIVDGMYLDFGYTYGNAIGNCFNIFLGSVQDNSSLATALAGQKSSLETKLADYLETIINLE